jgi:hypothetical protein
MTDNLENVPEEPPIEVERVAGQTIEEKEKLGELAIMIKAQQLFHHSRVEGDPYRSPDAVDTYELIVEKFSFIHDKDGADKRDRRSLTYRRLYRIGLDNEEELILDSQVIEYRESDNTVEAVITCDRFPVQEMTTEILDKVEGFIDHHIAKISDTTPDDDAEYGARLF